jgi:multicomponent Na+:H+ antiporter subunit C
MEILLAFVIGGLFAASTYMLLRRSLVKLLIGLAMLSHATNLLIFTTAKLTRGHPPLIPAKENTIASPFADPLPQALVLTAIVISFGLMAFALALAYRVYHSVGTDDLDQMRGTNASPMEKATHQ